MNTNKHELFIKENSPQINHNCIVHPILVCIRVYSWFSLV